MNRRDFLKLSGSSALILAAGAGVGLGVLGSGSAANLPWHIAGSKYSEPRIRALSWAILAPNPHNRQPWLVTLHKDLSLTLSLDMSKMLPETDPYNRQILIGLGCFCELLAMAAAEDGYELLFDWFPDGVTAQDRVLDGRSIANIHFKKGGMPDPLFKQVLKRRSFKEVFDETQSITLATLDQLRDAQRKGATLHTNNEANFIDSMRKLTVAAMDVEMKTERTYMESVNLMRIGTDQVKANPDGIDLDGRFMMALRYAGVLTHESLADMQSDVYQQGLGMVLGAIASSKGYLWLMTEGNARQDQINAGRNYIRANMQAAELGLHMHPLSQGLQEYPEMAAIFGQINALLGVAAPARVQMLTRLGYGPDIEASPRWPVETIVKG